MLTVPRELGRPVMDRVSLSAPLICLFYRLRGFDKTLGIFRLIGPNNRNGSCHFKFFFPILTAKNRFVYCKMERRIFRPKYVDHHQRWSRIFRSEETETDPFIWILTEISGIFGNGRHAKQIFWSPCDFFPRLFGASDRINWLVLAPCGYQVLNTVRQLLKRCFKAKWYLKLKNAMIRGIKTF